MVQAFGGLANHADSLRRSTPLYSLRQLVPCWRAAASDSCERPAMTPPDPAKR
jgi:hypothetical protein